jgi:gliding motility-associated protein GldM
MGATNCPETPRQKMIGMMYLVLTALLALNVSVEIINAFVTVNDGMEVTNQNFQNKNDATYSMFLKAYTGNPDKVRPFYDKAKQAQSLSKKMIDYINNVKWTVISKNEDLTLDEAKKLKVSEIKKKDNYDVSTTYFIGQSQDGSGGEAKKLRLAIEKYKEDMLNLVDPKLRTVMKLGLETKGDYRDASGQKQNWEMHNFYHTIIVANVTILNKLITDVLNAEYDVVNQLYSSVDASDFKFDKIGAKVIAKSNYVLTGETYEAEIFVAAYDTKSKIDASINGSTVVGDSGKITYKRAAGAEGLQKYSGVINVKTNNGIAQYPFEQEYIVARPSATVSADKMNVFYIGVDNPVTISVPGVANDKLRPSMTGGTLAKSGAGKYVVRVTQQGEANVTVNADFSGKVRNMGAVKFRVKRLPDPEASINGITEGMIDKNILMAVRGPMSKMPAGFDFEVSVPITSFVMSTVIKGDVFPFRSNGGQFSEEMKKAIQGAKRGQKFYFEAIQAKGPDGATRRLKPLILTIR